MVYLLHLLPPRRPPPEPVSPSPLPRPSPQGPSPSPSSGILLPSLSAPRSIPHRAPEGSAWRPGPSLSLPWLSALGGSWSPWEKVPSQACTPEPGPAPRSRAPPTAAGPRGWTPESPRLPGLPAPLSPRDRPASSLWTSPELASGCLLLGGSELTSRALGGQAAAAAFSGSPRRGPLPGHTSSARVGPRQPGLGPSARERPPPSDCKLGLQGQIWVSVTFGGPRGGAGRRAGLGR